jgi:hypothetical protein
VSPFGRCDLADELNLPGKYGLRQSNPAAIEDAIPFVSLWRLPPGQKNVFWVFALGG